MINKVILIGNVGNDPEVKPVGETRVANFSIACSERWTDKDGVKQEKTEWIRIQAWRKLAEIVEKYVHKGQQVYVEGKIRTRSYDKDGVTTYTTEVVIDTLKILGKKEGPNEGLTASDEPGATSGLKSKNDFSANQPDVPAPEEDDLPF